MYLADKQLELFTLGGTKWTLFLTVKSRECSKLGSASASFKEPAYRSTPSRTAYILGQTSFPQ